MDNMEQFVVKHEYTIWENQSDGFRVVRYRNAKETLTIPKGSVIIAKGYGLPSQKNTDIVLQGEWRVDPKYSGRFFFVQYFETLRPTTKEGMISYFKSLKVGIGPKTAALIYDTYGESAWDVIDNNPEQLISVKGITISTMKRLTAKLEETNAVRKILTLFKGCEEMTPRRAFKIFEKYGANAYSMLEENPYMLCKMSGFGFRTVDSIAQSLPSWRQTGSERLAAGIQAVFQANSTKGHTCVQRGNAISDLNRILQINDIDLCKNAFNKAYMDHECRIAGDYCYSRFNFTTEKSVAADALRLLRQETKSISDQQLDTYISAFELENSIELADEQKQAVKSCFKSHLSVITGGPGTGKSTIIKAILFVAAIINQDVKPLLMAPTGRAAKRMHEATGFPASTIHSALGIRFSNDAEGGKGSMDSDMPLDVDLVIVDEMSMVDQYIAKCLLSRIGEDTTVVLVGDADQLPSVGAGNVLAELIRTDIIPVSRLNVIFRQKEGDPIIINSRKILQGDTNLYYTNSFKSFFSHDHELVFRAACNFYVRCVDQFGIDNVTMLVPHRQKGFVCSNRLNEELERRLNPAKEGDVTFKSLGKEFRVGDRVMQMVNTDYAKNGDVGVVLAIEDRPRENDPYVKDRVCDIQFEGCPVVTYGEEEMRHVDWAYASSIHKSQGTECQTVIIVMTGEHELMARRNLLYTAVTRAKQNIALIGEKSAFDKAILNGDAEIRNTQLADFIQVLNNTVPQDEDPRYYRKKR